MFIDTNETKIDEIKTHHMIIDTSNMLQYNYYNPPHWRSDTGTHDQNLLSFEKNSYRP